MSPCTQRPIRQWRKRQETGMADLIGKGTYLKGKSGEDIDSWVPMCILQWAKC